MSVVKPQKHVRQKVTYSTPITCATQEKSSDDFLIRGIAINETTTRNGHKFVAEELMVAANSLKGKPLLKDHSNSVDAIVGTVTENVRFDIDRRAITFEAKVFDKAMQEKITQGGLSSVSIGAFIGTTEQEMNEDDEQTGNVIVRGIEFVELSLVAVPADPHAGFAKAIAEFYAEYTHSEVMDKYVEESLMAEGIKIEELRAERERLELECEQLRLEKAKVEKDKLEAAMQVKEEAEEVEPAAASEESEQPVVEDKTEGKVAAEEPAEESAHAHGLTVGEFGGIALSGNYDAQKGLTNLRRN